MSGLLAMAGSPQGVATASSPASVASAAAMTPMVAMPAVAATTAPLLAIEDLRVEFPAAGGGAAAPPGAPPGAPAGRSGPADPSAAWVAAVRGISLTVERGQCVGLVGESGSGKSLTALAVLRLAPPAARLGGRVLLDGMDLLALPESAVRAVRGARVGMVFQEPMTALNPFYTIGFQIAEALAAHRPSAARGRRALRAEAARLLDRVAIPDARRRLDAYPHQLSGGQRQRVLVAMALAGGPDLLIADEPTTALDVTLQAQVLGLLDELRCDLGLAILLITHDLGVVAAVCDRVAVAYAGQVVEQAAAADLLSRPQHPYTRGLLATLPRLGDPAPRGQLPVLPGQPVEAAARPPGCAFHPRCAAAMPICATDEPPAFGDRRNRCWLAQEVAQ